METKDIFGNEAKTEVKTAKSADVKKTTTRKTPAKAAAKETGIVGTVDEHSIIGGLCGAVCECLAEKAPVPVKRIGVNDRFGESGPAVALLEKYGLDGEGIYKQVKEFV